MLVPVESSFTEAGSLLAPDLSSGISVGSETLEVRADVRIAPWYAYDQQGTALPMRSTATVLRRSFALSTIACLCVLSAISAFGAMILFSGSILIAGSCAAIVLLSLVAGVVLGLKSWLTRREIARISATANSVQVSFLTKGHEYGRDIGCLTIEEGWLHFEGERTTFSLSPLDLSAKTNLAPPFSRLRLNRNSLDLSIVIRPVRVGARSSLQLAGLLTGWVQEAAPGNRITLLPPLSEDPMGNYDILSLKWVSWMLIGLCALIQGVGATLIFGPAVGLGVLVVVSIVLPIIRLVLELRRRDRAIGAMERTALSLNRLDSKRTPKVSEVP